MRVPSFAPARILATKIDVTSVDQCIDFGDAFDARPELIDIAVSKGGLTIMRYHDRRSTFTLNIVETAMTLGVGAMITEMLGVVVLWQEVHRGHGVLDDLAVRGIYFKDVEQTSVGLERFSGMTNQLVTWSYDEAVELEPRPV